MSDSIFKQMGSVIKSEINNVKTDLQTAINNIQPHISATAVPVVDTTVDCSAGNYFTKTVSGNTSFTFSNVPTSGKAYAFTFEVTYQSGTISWPASVVWPKGIAPVISANKVQLFVFITSNGGITWRGASSIDYAN